MQIDSSTVSAQAILARAYALESPPAAPVRLAAGETTQPNRPPPPPGGPGNGQGTPGIQPGGPTLSASAVTALQQSGPEQGPQAGPPQGGPPQGGPQDGQQAGPGGGPPPGGPQGGRPPPPGGGNRPPPPNETQQRDDAEEQAAAQNAANEEGADGLTAEEEAQVQALEQRDAEVRRHEQAHAAAGGQFAGGASYEYQRGPDGRLYAIGGEVSIDASPVQGDPQATIAKLQQVRRAALAPSEPSAQDQRVAAEASAQIAQARADLRTQTAEEQNSTDRSEQAEEPGGPQRPGDPQNATGPAGADGQRDPRAEALAQRPFAPVSETTDPATITAQAALFTPAPLYEPSDTASRSLRANQAFLQSNALTQPVQARGGFY